MIHARARDKDEPLPPPRPELQSKLIALKIMLNSTAIILIVVLTLPVNSVDLTVEVSATGTDVVLATVSRLESAQIFASDNRLLRRIAFVETDDGLQPEETSIDRGGIWRVDYAQFQQTTTNASLEEKRADVAAAFPEVDWGATVWEDLSKPLWSALAARLVLFLAETSAATGEIPGASDIEGQALFWRDVYNSDGDTAEFERRVYLLIEEESKSQPQCSFV